MWNEKYFMFKRENTSLSVAFHLFQWKLLRTEKVFLKSINRLKAMCLSLDFEMKRSGYKMTKIPATNKKQISFEARVADVGHAEHNFEDWHLQDSTLFNW